MFNLHNVSNFYFQDSPIIDFYPEDFKIDLNGKKFAWQGVALLPFVEEKRLFKALEPYYEVLTAAESKFIYLCLLIVNILYFKCESDSYTGVCMNISWTGSQISSFHKNVKK